MNKFFPEIKKNFGFGAMRLPKQGNKIDIEEFSQMVDLFLESGFNYFDTAHGYHNGASETALREALTSRYPRERYLLVNKLTHGMFDLNPDGVRKFFQMQLDACGVDYFDFYLMHAQNAGFFADFKSARAYETAFALKAEGKIRHVGISFHDHADVLDQILTEYPDIELVQIQFNYVDYDDAGIQSRQCYQVCEKHGKPVVVMEPLKGGALARLPEEANRLLDALASDSAVKPSAASYAIRYAASFPQIMMTLSGMSTLAQMEDNLSYMKDFQPLTNAEFATIDKVRDIFRAQNLIACTGCRYCTAGCPMEISIPDLISDMNAKKAFRDWNSDWYYSVHIQNHGRASDCIGCGQCESVCPQKLPIISILEQISATFDK
ncbi:MAG: aldo/keto reductase [Bacteroidales bacterium]|nr:aldo/keto reductase [Bacteroidales bacterium]